MSTPSPSSINLFYTEGSSDKVYQLQLEEKNNGWVVNFQYGRRHSTLKAGTKTEEPVSFEVAKQAYDKLLKEKTKKGYTPDTSGSIYQSVQDVNEALGERFTGVIPQLLNPIRKSDDIEKMLCSKDHIAQEKHDGERRSISFDGENVRGANRDGLTVSLPSCIVTGLKDCQTRFVLDGEIMGERFVAFDIVEHEGVSVRDQSVSSRLTLLEKVVANLPCLEMVKTAKTEKEKRELVAKLKARRAEGVVFKKKDALYVSGRPASGGNQLKWKFVESATVRVSDIHKTKRSVFVETDDGDTVVALGKCSVPPNYDMPQKGDIVEVEYLYLYKNGSLFQPQYKGPRGDKSSPDTISSFKLKAEVFEDDDADNDYEDDGEKLSSKMKV